MDLFNISISLITLLINPLVDKLISSMSPSYILDVLRNFNFFFYLYIYIYIQAYPIPIHSILLNLYVVQYFLIVLTLNQDLKMNPFQNEV